MTPRERVFDAWARAIARHTRAVLWTAAIVTVASVAATSQLHMRTGRIDLLGADDPVARAWLDFAADFGSPNGIILLVGGADAAHRREAVRTIAAQLEPRRDDLYRTILYRVEPEFRRRFGAYYLSAGARRAAADQLELLAPDGAPPAWDRVFDRLERQVGDALRRGDAGETDTAPLEQLADLLDRWAATVESGTPPALSALGLPEEASGSRSALPLDGEGYLVSRDGEFHLMVVDPRAEREDEAGFLLPFMETLLAGIETAEAGTPGLEVLMTGMSAYAYTDLQVMRRELPWLTLLGLAGVVAIFLSAFGSLRPALYAGGCLVLATIWTLGLTALTVGHLTLLSSVFGLILVGLGIDYGIHLLSRYQDERRALEPTEAMAAAYRHGVNGILTGGVTTAVAFAACGFADFAAFRELGLITAMGIACNLVAMLTVLPALILRWEASVQAGGTAPPAALWSRARVSGPFTRLGTGLHAAPAAGLVLGAAVLFLLVPSARHVQFDHNFLHMQPADSPYPRAEAELESRTAFAPQFALILADTDADVAALTPRLAALPTVREVTSARQLLPDPLREPAAGVRELVHAAAVVAVPGVPTADQMEHIAGTMDRLRIRFDAYGRASFAIADKTRLGHAARAARALTRLRNARHAMPAATWLTRHETFFTALADAWGSAAADLAQTAPAPPTLADLPRDIRARFQGRSGRQAVYAIPTQTLWERPFLLRFNADVASVSDSPTGMGALLERLVGQASAAPRQVAPWVGAAILAVLALDFRRALDVVAAAATLLLGICAALGLMSLTGLQFTPMNVLAFPLLLGIGIDNSVHMLHALRATESPRLDVVLGTTGKAVFLASATTLVTFGLLGLSTHRGLGGFGQIMMLGVATCFVVAIIVLPCAWVFVARMRGGARGPHEAADA